MAGSVKLIESFTGKKKTDNIAVDGYIRQMEKALFVEDDDQIIPSVINDVCMEYYSITSDRFDPILHSKKLQVTDFIASRGKSGADTAYLSNILNEKGIYDWKFEIIERGPSTNIYIGLWDNKRKAKLTGLITDVGSGASCFNARFGELRGDQKKMYDEMKYEDNCPACNDGDIIQMVFEFKDKDKSEVKYIVNDKDYGTAFILPEGEYRAFVCLY